MIDYEPLLPYFDRYDGRRDECLCITMVLRPGSHLAGYDPLNLDNLLARCVVDEATQGQGLPNSPDAYNLPAPLRCLWRSPEGFPLWAVTPFFPVGEAVSDVAYWHKRLQSGQWTKAKSGKFAVRSTQGRWMERRVPLPTKLCREWQAWCIGDGEEIARLLRPVTFVGKRRTNGFGEVEEWRIDTGTFDLIRDGRLTRAMPALAAPVLLDGYMPEGEPAPVGWTPPQWKPSLFAPGWWPGTPVAPVVDWYAEVAG